MPSSFSSDADIERRVAELEARMAESATASDLDVVWIILSAVLVFFMQVGFAMVSVRLRALAPQNPSPGPQTTSPPPPFHDKSSKSDFFHSNLFVRVPFEGGDQRMRIAQESEVVSVCLRLVYSSSSLPC